MPAVFLPMLKLARKPDSTCFGRLSSWWCFARAASREAPMNFANSFRGEQIVSPDDLVVYRPSRKNNQHFSTFVLSPDEFGEVLIPAWVESVDRIQRSRRFPATSKFFRWRHPSRSCRCGLIAPPRPSRPHFVAGLVRRGAEQCKTR